MDHNNLNTWQHLLLSGHVLGVIASPPCETWSAVRFNRLPGNKGPRPVRSCEQLWGLDALTYKECKQVWTANVLYRVALWFFALAWRASLFGLLEHPDEAKHMRAPSSWQLPTVKYLLEQDGIVLHTVEHCAFGAPYKKNPPIFWRQI